jgi:hypothetical protein
MSNDGKFVTGEASAFAGGNSYFKNMQLALVVKTGTVTVSQTNVNQKNKDLIFNSDPYIIRCRIVGSNYDNIKATEATLPNCFPLIPKHLSPIPKEGEYVLVFMYGPDDVYGDRFYVGPIISNPRFFNKQTLENGATAGLSIGLYDPEKDLSKIEAVKGIYSEYDTNNTFSINGRENSDLVFKPSEVLIRAGKFLENKPLEFNQVNPAYIQIKHGFNYVENSTTPTPIIPVSGPINAKKISVNNIVADKINLITYNGNPNFNITQRDLLKNTTPYITDDELNNIIETAHPLVFGDVLLQYLQALRAAFESHVHNNFGASSPTDNVTIGNSVADFKNLAPKLEATMLSKNVRTN